MQQKRLTKNHFLSHFLSFFLSVCFQFFLLNVWLWLCGRLLCLAAAAARAPSCRPCYLRSMDLTGTWTKNDLDRHFIESCGDATVGPNVKTPPKFGLKTCEIDRSFSCLKSFEHDDRKRKLCVSAEACMEKPVKSLRMNLFSAGFWSFGNSVRRTTARHGNIISLYISDPNEAKTRDARPILAT